MKRDVVLAILAKDKAHCLDLYLDGLLRQTWPKERTHLYVRTNNNNDNTRELLACWLRTHGAMYASVHFDDSEVAQRVQEYGQHDWNPTRFTVLAKIRQDSVAHAQRLGAHYFVVDCDNFIRPTTLEAMHDGGLEVVGPMLTMARRLYSNYHNRTDRNGYFLSNECYEPILSRKVRGLIEVEVIHCTYFIRHSALRHVQYTDGSARHEYVIFSERLRKAGVPQYLDNRIDYGYLTFAETREQLAAEPWFPELLRHAAPIVVDNEHVVPFRREGTH